MLLTYNIQKPIWNTRSVGIATHRLVPGATMEITISYKDSDGVLVYPGKYRMACSKMKTYPVQVVKGGVKLHVIPVEDFDATS